AHSEEDTLVELRIDINTERNKGANMCKSWNAAHSEAEALVELRIDYMLETTWADYLTPKARRKELWSQKCPS
ncbi:MAG: hypothetical protein AAFW75_00800, partial [Cyanobacteria bacterium J06636_16]